MVVKTFRSCSGFFFSSPRKCAVAYGTIFQNIVPPGSILSPIHINSHFLAGCGGQPIQTRPVPARLSSTLLPPRHAEKRFLCLAACGCPGAMRRGTDSTPSPHHHRRGDHRKSIRGEGRRVSVSCVRVSKSARLGGPLPATPRQPRAQLRRQPTVTGRGGSGFRV